MKWELVIEHAPGAMENSTYRMQIPEGWIYRYGGQMVFVPVASAALPHASGFNPVYNAFGTTKHL